MGAVPLALVDPGNRKLNTLLILNVPEGKLRRTKQQMSNESEVVYHRRRILSRRPHERLAVTVTFVTRTVTCT
jgi:hypothetical protein